jgi:Tol biopolymer transport system component
MRHRLTIAMGTAVALGAIASPAGAAFPGQNGTIALLHGDISAATAWQLGRPIDLYSMNPDGSRARRLVRDAVGASFSPDGNRLVFLKASDRGGERGCPGCVPFRGRASVLTVADSDGTSPRPLTARRHYLAAQFSSDGRGINFVRVDRGHRTLLSFEAPTRPRLPDSRVLRRVRYGIYTVGVDGGASRRIATIRGGLIGAIAWSPAGGQVVLAHRYLRGPNRLLSVSPDGAMRTVGRFRRTIGGLGFSPSADRLAVALLSRTSLLSRKSSGIYVMAPRGGSLRRVTTAPSFGPVWSPDGTAIAYMGLVGRGPRSSAAIYAVPAGGGRRQRLRDFGDVDVLPVAWQPLAGPATNGITAALAKRPRPGRR